jgi:hypothetical protein
MTRMAVSESYQKDGASLADDITKWLVKFSGNLSDDLLMQTT